RSQPILLQSAENFSEEPVLERRAKPAPSGIGAVIGGVGLGILWMLSSFAYLWCYSGPAGLAHLSIQQTIPIGFAVFAPAVMIVVIGWAFSRGLAMNHAALTLADVTNQLFSADET